MFGCPASGVASIKHFLLRFFGVSDVYPGSMFVFSKRSSDVCSCNVLEVATASSIRSSWITLPRSAHQHLLLPASLPPRNNHRSYFIQAKKVFQAKMTQKVNTRCFTPSLYPFHASCCEIGRICQSVSKMRWCNSNSMIAASMPFCLSASAWLLT